MKVALTREAMDDLIQIGQYIVQHNASRALALMEELHAGCFELADMPYAYMLLPHRPESGIRRRPYAGYLIFYRVTGSAVEILRILHGARDYERILFPRNE